MKKILFLFLLIPAISFAQNPESLIHNPKLYVDDYANIFTDQQRQELDGIVRKFFDTAQISIVTIKSFNGIDPSDYTVRLGRKWGVGGKSNNGLIIVIGIDDHKMFAATGGGIQGDLPDITIVDLQHEYAIPKFKQGQYFEGTRDLLNAYINQLSPSAKALRAKEAEVQKQVAAQRWENIKAVGLNILFVLALLSIIALPFYLRWRKIKKAEEERQRQLEAEAERKAHEKTIADSKIEAEKFIKEYPSPEELLVKHPNMKTAIADYSTARTRIQNNLKSNYSTDYTTLLVLVMMYYNNIISPPHVYVESKYVEPEDDSYDKKRKNDDDSGSFGSSYIGSSSYDSGSSSDSSSSGSDFGGGSFDGGGGGSSW